MSESVVPANAMGDGSGIAKFDPLMGMPILKRNGKKLRDIIGNLPQPSNKKGSRHGL